MMMFHHYNRHNDERTSGTVALLSCCLYTLKLDFADSSRADLSRAVVENILFPIFVNVNYLTTFIVVPLLHANDRNMDLWENNRGLEKA